MRRARLDGPLRGRRSALVVLVGLLLLTVPAPARGQMASPGSGQVPASESFLDRHFDLHGYLRVRFDVLENLDLNHGPTPTTGQPVFPVAISDPNATLVGGNMRLRLEPSVRIGWGVSVHARIDLLDNVVLGSTPSGLPASAWVPMSGAATSQEPPASGVNAVADSIRVKRAWGELILPIGVLSAGRMGALVDWGTGFFINSGSCLDCDQGDVGDRIAFAMPIFDHIAAFAFDFGASGPTSAAYRADAQPVDMDRRDNVLSFALSVARFERPAVVERYRRAGRTVVMYGLLASVRTQEYDVPAYYLTGDLSRPYTADDVVRRGLLAFGGDVWFGLRSGGLTLDIEGAMLLSRIENASLLPGTEFVQDVTARQFGGVARASYALGRLALNLEVGAASGDSAPGFGVRYPLTQLSAQPGDLDGPQVAVPGDTEVNNFRFSPDYHVDQILWRRIVGTVTDAAYVRPSVRWEPLTDLVVEGVLVTSLALNASSTPGGEHPLGVELDLGLSYVLEPGFVVQAVYGVLFPLSGLRNTVLSLDPEPAHLFHMVLAFRM